MFERYTEKARRVIFFARIEAMEWGANEIEPSHLLLGLIREDLALFSKLHASTHAQNSVAAALGLKAPAEKASASADMPLTQRSKRVLALAAEEAEKMLHTHIGTGHLLLGLLQEPSAACTLLQDCGVQSEEVRRTEVASAAQATVDPNAANVNIIGQLRHQFRALTLELKPEMEPAVSYRLERAK